MPCPFRQRLAISSTEAAARTVASPDARLDGPSWLSQRQRSHGIVLRAASKERPGPPSLADTRGAPDRNRDLDRTDLPPPPTPRPSRQIDPDRIRTHHEQ